MFKCAAAAGAAILLGAGVVVALTLLRRGAAEPTGVIAYFVPDEMYVYRVRPDGTEARRLVPADSGDAAPALSRDGTQIAYVTQEGALGIARIDGTHVRRVFLGGSIDQPAWSPSGKQIVCSLGWKDESSREWHQELYIVDVAGKRDPTLVTSGAAPDWSPDGRKIAYEDSGLSVIDLGTHRIQRLGPGSTPRWAPDQSRIAYTTQHTLVVMRADGSHRHPIVRSADVLGDLAWSPDGSRIVFTAVAAGTPQVRMVDVDGSHVRVLVRGGADPDWSVE